MKVYVVVGGWYAEAGGWNYVGMDGETLRLFDCLSTAEAYRATLLEDGYTEVTLTLTSVNMESALLA